MEAVEKPSLTARAELSLFLHLALLSPKSEIGRF